jgi:hypothetical protein
MYWVMVAVGVVCVTAMGAAGVAAVTTGWTYPFSGSLVLRPRLWGTGVLLSAGGMAAFLFLGPLGVMPPRAYDLPLVGMAVNLVGLALQSLARRPGRATALPTKTAS